MNFIAKHIHTVGLLLLTSFVATAAAMYWELPAKFSHAQGSTGSYSCPMHPEIVSNRPGDCPKCGMALARAAAISAEPTHRQHASTVAVQSSDPAAASEHAGCAHAENSGSGCCGSRAPAVTNALPSGCTRNLPQLPTPPSP